MFICDFQWWFKLKVARVNLSRLRKAPIEAIANKMKRPKSASGFWIRVNQCVKSRGFITFFCSFSIGSSAIKAPVWTSLVLLLPQEMIFLFHFFWLLLLLLLFAPAYDKKSFLRNKVKASIFIESYWFVTIYAMISWDS